jgi:hypothetical protein
LLLGVGNKDVDYVVQKREMVELENGDRVSRITWRCPFYVRWYGLLLRCYSEAALKQSPTYRGCTICDEWLNFSVFKQWMEGQEWEDKQLDKDLLVEGNKIYSPDTCVFISSNLNMFLSGERFSKGRTLLGTSWAKDKSKFAAHCRDPSFPEKSSKSLGYFDTEKEAHEAWKSKKHEHAKEYAKMQTDPRVVLALENRYKGEMVSG